MWRIIAALLFFYGVFISRNAIHVHQASLTPAPTIRGLGILGDSGHDEYRADDARGSGTLYAATTLAWTELLANKRNVSLGPWSDSSRGEPRRRGYEYNWARSGATAASMISSGQHTGLAQQIAAGKISHVFLQIGANDFGWWYGNYGPIYDGTMSDAQLQAKANTMLQHITTAVDTVRNAGTVAFVIATVPDVGLSPVTITNYPDASKRQRVSQVVQEINNGIKAMSQTRNIPVFDTNQFALSLLGKVDSSGYLTIGGEKINAKVTGYEPHHMTLGDTIHGGTVMEGLLANAMVIEMFNRNYGTAIPTFTDSEILINAGILIDPLSPSPGDSTSMQIRLFFHGIGKGGDNVNPLGTGTMLPLHQQRQVILEFYNAQNQLSTTKQATVVYRPASGDFEGNVVLSSIPSGVYTVRITSPHYLGKVIPGIVTINPGQPIALPLIAFVTGDIIDDNRLNILDYNVLLDCFSDLTPARNCEDPDKKLKTDLTDDGNVNQFDYNLFLRELSVQTGE